MKSCNIFEVHWKIRCLGGGGAGCHEKPFADLSGGGLDKKEARQEKLRIIASQLPLLPICNQYDLVLSHVSSGWPFLLVSRLMKKNMTRD